MSSNIFFTGLSSGIDTASIVDQLMALERRPLNTLNQKTLTLNQSKTEMTTVQAKMTDLQRSIQTLTDARLSPSFDLFQQKKVESADETKLTANVTFAAQETAYALKINNLASATTAKSISPAGQAVSSITALGDISGGVLTSGTFSVFVNGNRQEITIDASTQTLGDVLNSISAVLPSGSANIDAQGKISFDFQNGTAVQFGAASDTANFGQVSGLIAGVTTTGVGNDTFTSSRALNEAKSAGTLTNNAVKLNTTVTAGVVTIAGDAFTIDSTTTLDSLIADVNAKGKVIMAFDKTNNQVKLTSKSTGQQAIALGNGTDTSNFLSVVGLVSGADSLVSQTLGQNAQFEINGTTYTSTSNTGVGESVHGLSGLTLDLKSDTAGAAIALTVSQDKDKLTTAVKDMLTKLNAVMSVIADKTNSETGSMKREQNLIRLRSSLRNSMSQSVSGLSSLSALSQIGITTGAPTASPGQTPSSSFQLDESKFLAAFAENPESVKALLVGNSSVTGLVESLKTNVVDASLNSEFGIFAARDKSISDQLRYNNDSIKRLTQRLDKREKTLRAQFTAMEQTISRLKQQQSSLG